MSDACLTNVIFSPKEDYESCRRRRKIITQMCSTFLTWKEASFCSHEAPQLDEVVHMEGGVGEN